MDDIACEVDATIRLRG